MPIPVSFYNTQLKKFKDRTSQLKKQLVLLSFLRLSIFTLTALGVYFTFYKWQWAVIVVIIGGAAFLMALSKYTRLKQVCKLQAALVALNEEEIRMATGDFHHRDQGTAFQDPKHAYSYDIDLFGKGSFFQFVNRTSIKEGTQLLADTLKANTITDIPLRQEAIKELASKPEWRQLYSAKASLIKTQTPANTIINWLNHYQPLLPKAAKWLPYVFMLGSVTAFLLVYLNILGLAVLGYWLLLGLILTGYFLKSINQLATHSTKIKETFRQYALLLKQIETENFTAELLLKQQKKIATDAEKASKIFKKLSKSLDALDHRNNLISAIFGNGFFLIDLINSYRIEQWVLTYKDKVNDWFETVSFFEAYNSLGNYAFNHPENVFPTITTTATTIKANALGHPLISDDKRINNDLQIENEQFFIITGANMAGKSTFLRTVSLHIVMANVGLPVCAKSSTYSPIKLITSMRTSDSLAEESSYFFSELTRLKFIVDTIENAPYFIVLDEILKGTNSTDKAIGSRKFVEKLVASKATGIIATHDLSLCTIETQLNQVKNYYFDAAIVNDELYFDYKFKKGVCNNMNASFLLNKMNIV